MNRYTSRPLNQLIDFIEDQYHQRHRADLPELIAMATKVEKVHAEKDSAEKPYECFDEAQHERKICNDFRGSSVRPEALEG